MKNTAKSYDNVKQLIIQNGILIGIDENLVFTYLVIK
jgi:hypothetical protein